MIERTRKTAETIVLAALAVALSPLFVPVGITKIYPAQHAVNVLAGVLVGPWYAAAAALAASAIRNALGTGTIFAFPGSVIGAVLAGCTYRLTRSFLLAAAAEIVGTGLIASTLSALVVAPLAAGRSMPLAVFVVAFSASTIAGSAIAVAGLYALRRAGYPTLQRPEEDREG